MRGVELYMLAVFFALLGVLFSIISIVASCPALQSTSRSQATAALPAEAPPEPDCGAAPIPAEEQPVLHRRDRKDEDDDSGLKLRWKWDVDSGEFKPRFGFEF